MGAVYLQASGCPIAGLLQKMVECKPASCVPIFPSQGFYSLSKAAKAEGFVAIPKTMTGVRHLKMRRNTRDVFIRDLERSAFLREVVFWSITPSDLQDDFA